MNAPQPEFVAELSETLSHDIQGDLTIIYTRKLIESIGAETILIFLPERIEYARMSQETVRMMHSKYLTQVITTRIISVKNGVADLSGDVTDLLKKYTKERLKPFWSL